MPIDPNLAAALESQLFDTQRDLVTYAMLDGAINPGLLPALADLEPEHCCLWLGELEPELREVAPYLVRLHPDTGFVHYLIRQGYGLRWGIFAQSAASLLEMRSHFRRLTQAQDSTGKRYYMRFYDPNIMPMLLRTATPEQLAMLYGPVAAYLCELPQEFWKPGLDTRFRIHVAPSGMEARRTRPIFVLTEDQDHAFAEIVREFRAAMLLKKIMAELRDQNRAALDPYPQDEAERVVLETIYDAFRLGVADERQIQDLSVINLITETNVLRAEAFTYVTEHPHLHPYSKARHLILSFDAICNQHVSDIHG